LSTFELAGLPYSFDSWPAQYSFLRAIAEIPLLSLPAVQFHEIEQNFPNPHGGGMLRVLDGISFAVAPGRFTAVVGPSGCGKSTLLQMAAGLLFPSAGTVRHRGAPVTAVNREVGFIPQQALLFPWKTLYENVELPLVLRGTPASERHRRVSAAIAAVGLEGFERHYAHQLSGGMQKRGSIARTLVYRPDLFLMDEPFGALDAQTRMVMQDDLQALASDSGATVLFVTHDLAEAILLADNVIVLSQRPARVLANVAVDLKRPRNVFEPFKTPGFAEAYERIWSIFRTEIAGSRRWN